MTTEYTINGTTASLAPYSQRWRQVTNGRDSLQRATFQAYWEIDLSFDSASITHTRQWLEAASAASANLTILNKYQTDYTDLSAVQLEVTDAPTLETVVFGPWSMVVKGTTR